MALPDQPPRPLVALVRLLAHRRTGPAVHPHPHQQQFGQMQRQRLGRLWRQVGTVDQLVKNLPHPRRLVEDHRAITRNPVAREHRLRFGT